MQMVFLKVTYNKIHTTLLKSLFFNRLVIDKFDSHFFVIFSDGGEFVIQGIATLRLVRNAYNTTQPKNITKAKFNRAEHSKPKNCHNKLLNNLKIKKNLFIKFFFYLCFYL